MYSYNVPVYNKNMQKIYRVMSVLWAAQKTESSLCFLKNIYKKSARICEYKPDVLKGDYYCFFQICYCWVGFACNYSISRQKFWLHYAVSL